MNRSVADAAPLSLAQVRALLAGTARELLWGSRASAHEIRRWRAMALAIPDASLRADALHALTHKRGHADGAALFAILPRRRNRALVHALVAYETILDFLDNVSERHPTRANGQQLHRALIDAVDLSRPLADYYRFHPWRDDGGYLVALVTACRRGCRALPSYDRVRTVLVREARRALVLGLNHELDPDRRDADLRAWAAREYPGASGLTWFELSGAASASLLVHALLALAAAPQLTDAEIARVHAAHWPWIALATTMLDSCVDRADDEAAGNHSYVAHYDDAGADPDAVTERICQSITLAMRGARSLPDGHRHAVVVGCMIALYLSKGSAGAPDMRARTRAFVKSGGSLVRLLIPVLRAWRVLHAQRA